MRIPFEELKSRFQDILIRSGFSDSRAEQCAQIFAENSRDGVYTHGLNRFPTFISMVEQGLIHVNADPECEHADGAVERWNGNLGPGMLNARVCMDQAIQLAGKYGIGCVSIRNTNHWMRGGTYGWQAAEAGYIGICFTNTIAVVPPWGGIDPRLGNNPLVIGVPRKKGHVVLDMAISQYSFGKLMQYQSSKEELPLPGGYDSSGQLTTDASAIIASRRLLPVGFWKGSGLSLILDILVTVLSGGRSVADITEGKSESGLSQVFIVIRQDDQVLSGRLIEQILSYTRSSAPLDAGRPVAYPGENTLKTRELNMKEGIPVDEEIWQRILAM